MSDSIVRQAGCVEQRLVVEDCTVGQLPSVLEVIREAFSEYRGVLDPPSSAERQTVPSLAADLREAGALIARVGDAIVGCVFYRIDGDRAYIYRLGVPPKLRKHGIGSALISAVLSRARAAGCVCVWLSVRLKLHANIAFFRKLGFQVTEYKSHPGHQCATYVNMQKMTDEHAKDDGASVENAAEISDDGI
jgi:ribosomal protein S18 acetylase RimI-like enzyme